MERIQTRNEKAMFLEDLQMKVESKEGEEKEAFVKVYSEMAGDFFFTASINPEDSGYRSGDIKEVYRDYLQHKQFINIEAREKINENLFRFMLKDEDPFAGKDPFNYCGDDE